MRAAQDSIGGYDTLVTQVAWLLGDLMHLCCREGASFDDALSMPREHYEGKMNGERDAMDDFENPTAPLNEATAKGAG